MKLKGNIASAGFINDLANRTADLAGYGYLPGDFGSVSVVLSNSKVSPYFWDEFNNNYYKFPKPLPGLKNRFILLTKNNLELRAISASRSKTHEYLGIIRISQTGDGFQLMWGFYHQSLDHDNIYRQLVAHNEAILRNKDNSVVIYASPTYLQQYSYFGSEDNEFGFTKDLWSSFPQLAKVSQSGIGLVDRYRHDHAEFVDLIKTKLSKYNMLVIKTQGVILAGKSWNEILGMATTLDRAAQSALTIGELKNLVPTSDFLKIIEDETKIDPELLAYLKANDGKKLG